MTLEPFLVFILCVCFVAFFDIACGLPWAAQNSAPPRISLVPVLADEVLTATALGLILWAMVAGGGHP